MNWQAWIVVGALALSSLMTVAMVGKPRKPIEPITAAVSLVLNGFVIWLVVEAVGK